jgi:hypothetical protein
MMGEAPTAPAVVVKSKETLRIESLQRSYEKRMSDKWKKALRELKINENLIADRSLLA